MHPGIGVRTVCGRFGPDAPAHPPPDPARPGAIRRRGGSPDGRRPSPTPKCVVGGPTAMRPVQACRALWLLGAWLAGAAVARADDLAPPTATAPVIPPAAVRALIPGGPEVILQRALDF